MTFSNLTPETKAEIAIQMVIMDAFEKKGANVSQAQIIAFMQSPQFDEAVKNYIAMMQ